MESFSLGLLLAGLGFVETPISAGKETCSPLARRRPLRPPIPPLGCVFSFFLLAVALRPNFVIERV